MAPTEGQEIERLLTMLRRAGIVGDIGDARLVTDGMQNVVLIIDDELVARVPRTGDGRRSLVEEHRLLAHLSEHLSVPLPVPITDREDFAVHRLLRGEPITRAALGRLEGRRRDLLIDDVAQFLVELHAAPVGDDVRASAATKPLSAWLELRERAAETVMPLLWRHQREWLSELFRPVETGELSLEYAPVIIHGDLAPYHLLYEPGSARLTGVLDFGMAGWGDPAVDLACLLCVWGERWATGLVRRYPELAEMADRARFMAAALPLEWALTGLEQRQPDLLVAHLGHAAMDLGQPGTFLGVRESSA